ncbi:MAG: RNHCP domain-containing protein [Patescibacteria group bacterium]
MEQRKNFIKHSEDFDCANCGSHVVGNGYTNHCPICLWSLHVDNLPGDRENNCRGKMKPIQVEITSEGYDVVHQCQSCRVIKRNKVSDNDDRDTLVKIIEQSK